MSQAGDTPAREARRIAIDLIRWEMDAASGERMERACDKYGPDRMRTALESIILDLERKGANP